MIRYAKIAGVIESTGNFGKQAKHTIVFFVLSTLRSWCRHSNAYDSSKMVFNPLTPGSDWYMISPYSVSNESK